MKVAKNMDSVFADCTQDELDFDIFFPDDDTIIDFVAGVDEAGNPLTGEDFDFSTILDENGDPLEDEDDAKEREGKVAHNEPAEATKDEKLEVGGEVGDGKEVSGKENSAESQAHDVTKEIENAIGETVESIEEGSAKDSAAVIGGATTKDLITNAIDKKKAEHAAKKEQKIVAKSVNNPKYAEKVANREKLAGAVKDDLKKIGDKINPITKDAEGKNHLTTAGKVELGAAAGIATAAAIAAAKKKHDKKKAEKEAKKAAEAENTVSENFEYEGYTDLVECVLNYYMSPAELLDENYIDIAIATADYMIENADYLQAPDVATEGDAVAESAEIEIVEEDGDKKDRKKLAKDMAKTIQGYIVTNGCSDCIIAQKPNKDFFKGTSNSITFVVASKSERSNIAMGLLVTGAFYDNKQGSNTRDAAAAIVRQNKDDIAKEISDSINKPVSIKLNMGKHSRLEIIVTLKEVAAESADPIQDECDTAEREGKVKHDTSNVEGEKQEVLGAANAGEAKEDPIQDECDCEERDAKVKHDDKTIEGISSKIIGAALEANNGDIDKILDDNTAGKEDAMDAAIVPDDVQTAEASNKIDIDVKNTLESIMTIIGSNEMLEEALDYSEYEEFKSVVEFAVNYIMDDEEVMSEDASDIAIGYADALVTEMSSEIMTEGLKDVFNKNKKSAASTNALDIMQDTISDENRQKALDKMHGVANKKDSAQAPAPATDAEKKGLAKLGNSIKNATTTVGPDGKSHLKTGTKVALGAAGLAAAGIAAKKIYDKKKAEEEEDENSVKENYEYPEYQELLEAIISGYTPEQLADKNTINLAIETADLMIENAGSLDTIVSEKSAVGEVIKDKIEASKQKSADKKIAKAAADPKYAEKAAKRAQVGDAVKGDLKKIGDKINPITKDAEGKNHLTTAGKVELAAAGAAAATAAAIAAKKKHDKKKAEKKAEKEAKKAAEAENEVNENFAYPEYAELLEQVVDCLDEEVLMNENATSIAIGVADKLIENAMLSIDETVEEDIVFTGWRSSTVTEASKAKIDDTLIADDDDADIEAIDAEKDTDGDAGLDYSYDDDDELIDIVDSED